MKKYITIVIEASDEKAARQLSPGEMIGPNRIVSCSLGDLITMGDALKELIPAGKNDEVAALEHASIKPFLP